MRVAGLVAGLVMWLVASAAWAAPVAFEDSEDIESGNGTAQLRWSGDKGEYQVQLRHGDRVQVIYHGALPSAHVSGLVDGEYELRVRAREGDRWSAWSEPKRLVVTHHSMPLVIGLMSLGLLTFLATVAVVVRSSRWIDASRGAP